MNKNSLKQRPPVPKPPVQTKAKVSLLRNLAPELYDPRFSSWVETGLE